MANSRSAKNKIKIICKRKRKKQKHKNYTIKENVWKSSMEKKNYSIQTF